MKTFLVVGAALVLAVGSMSAGASNWHGGRGYAGGHGFRGYHRGPSFGAIAGTTLAVGLVVGAVDAAVTSAYPTYAHSAYGAPAYGYAPYGYAPVNYGYAPAVVYAAPVIYTGRRW